MAKINGQLEKAQLQNLSADPTLGVDGKVWLNTTTSKPKIDIGSAAHELITNDSTSTLTNKTIDADSNTITNIENADIKVGAAIARNKLASGSNSHVLINDGSGVMSSEATLAKSRGGTGADNSSVTFPSSGTIITADSTSTLTNKTFDADGTGNSITNIENADIKAGAAIALNKLAATTVSRALVSDGSGVISPATTTATQIGYLSTTTSDVQTQLDAKVAKSTATTKGDIFVATGSATVVRQGIGSDGDVLTADSSQTNGLKWAAPSSSPATSGDVTNASFTVSVAASAATIALKDAAGSNPSAGSPVKITFDNGDGTITQRTVSSALSITITSGATLGHGDGVEAPVYIYAVDNAGTVSLAVSSVLKDIKPQNVTTMASTSDDSGLYGTSLTSKSIALIGVWMSTQTTAGTWAATTGDKLVGIPRNWVPVAYYSAALTATQPTVSADTWRDAEASPSYLTLPPGKYRIGYHVSVTMTYVATPGLKYGNVQITDASNNGVTNTLGLLLSYLDTSLNVLVIPLSREAELTVTTSTQYKLRVRCSAASTSATATVSTVAYTGSLTGNDDSPLFYARRIG